MKGVPQGAIANSLGLGLVIGMPCGLLYALATGAPIGGCIVGCICASWAASHLMMTFPSEGRKYIIAIFIGKLLLTYYQAYNKSLPMGGVDWWNYHFGAINNIQQFNNPLLILLASSSDMFTRIVAVLYWLFGIHTMQINLYILATSFVAALYFYKSYLLLIEDNRQIEDNWQIGVRASLIFLLWPIDIIYSVTYLREMPIQMCVIISFYHFLAFKKWRRPASIVLAIVFISLGCMMHSGVIALLFVYVAFATLRRDENPSKILSPMKLGTSAFVLLMLRLSPFWNGIVAKLGNVDSADKMVERVSQFVRVQANTQYISDLPTSFAGMCLQAPFRTVLFAVVPLPWMVHSFETVFAWLVDALPQLWLLYRMTRLVPMTKHSPRHFQQTCIAWLCLLGAYIVCGMGTTAYGNAIRHRAKIVPIILLFAYAFYTHIQKQHQIRS